MEPEGRRRLEFGVRRGNERRYRGLRPSPGRRDCDRPLTNKERLRSALVAALLVATALAGSGARAAGGAAPPPDLSRLVPTNYRVLRVLHARLSGQTVPEVVVTSVGPLNRYELHPSDLQVLSWDALASRWNVVFDAQRVRFGPAPLIDPRAQVLIGRIAFAHLFPGTRHQLVFAASRYGGSGDLAELVVVDFWNAEAGIDYLWSGELGATFRMAGSRAKPELVATAPYRTVIDPPRQPVRSYQFTVGIRRGFLRVVRDDRPWVGLLVTGSDRSPLTPVGAPRSHLRVVDVVAHSPAAAAFHPGDVIIGVTTPRTAVKAGPFGPALIDEIAAHHAGDWVRFTVHRGAQYLRVTLKLGSRIDPSAAATLPSTDDKIAVV